MTFFKKWNIDQLVSSAFVTLMSSGSSLFLMMTLSLLLAITSIVLSSPWSPIDTELTSLSSTSTRFSAMFTDSVVGRGNMVKNLCGAIVVLLPGCGKALLLVVPDRMLFSVVVLHKVVFFVVVLHKVVFCVVVLHKVVFCVVVLC